MHKHDWERLHKDRHWCRICGMLRTRIYYNHKTTNLGGSFREHLWDEKYTYKKPTGTAPKEGDK